MLYWFNLFYLASDDYVCDIFDKYCDFQQQYINNDNNNNNYTSKINDFNKFQIGLSSIYVAGVALICYKCSKYFFAIQFSYCLFLWYKRQTPKSSQLIK